MQGFDYVVWFVVLLQGPFWHLFPFSLAIFLFKMSTCLSVIFLVAPQAAYINFNRQNDELIYEILHHAPPLKNPDPVVMNSLSTFPWLNFRRTKWESQEKIYLSFYIIALFLSNIFSFGWTFGCSCH